jgi:hypothetical protein
MKLSGVISAIALGIFAFSAMPAKAQMVNCFALSNSPFMCIKNNTPYPISAIQAYDGMSMGKTWIDIPGGLIISGGTTVVKFGTWSSCVKTVAIRTASGQTHAYPNVNVCTSTSFNVTGW